MASHTGLKIDFDGSVEEFTWESGKDSLEQWRSLIPDVTFTGVSLPESGGLYMLADDNALLRNDWHKRINLPATVLYGNAYGLPLCHPDAMITGPVLIIGDKVEGDGHSTGLNKGQLALLHTLVTSLRGKSLPR